VEWWRVGRQAGNSDGESVNEGNRIRLNIKLPSETDDNVPQLRITED